MVFTGPFKICWYPGIKQGIVVTGIIVYVEAMMYTYMTFLYDWRSEISRDLMIADQN